MNRCVWSRPGNHLRTGNVTSCRLERLKAALPVARNTRLKCPISLPLVHSRWAFWNLKSCFAFLRERVVSPATQCSFGQDTSTRRTSKPFLVPKKGRELYQGFVPDSFQSVRLECSSITTVEGALRELQADERLEPLFAGETMVDRALRETLMNCEACLAIDRTCLASHLP